MPVEIERLWEKVGFSPNPAQEQAIKHIDGPLFLPAGPGSGKTRVLLWRTVNLIACHSIKPEEIFLSTFTEKAAFQLKQGLNALLGLVTNITNQPYDIAEMYIGTVHSLCQRMLTDRSLSDNKERMTRPIILDDLQQYFFLRRCLNDLLESVPCAVEDVNRFMTDGKFASSAKHNALTDCITLFNRFSEEILLPDEIFDQADDDLKPILTMYRGYLDRLKGQGAAQTDFSLLQQKALDLLETNRTACETFKHVIIDEYQDTNAVQECIFFKLAECHQNLCVVGDDEQALYRFRGATLENFVEFPERCEKHFGRQPTKIPLSTNYRSRKTIVDFYTRFMEFEDWRRADGRGFYRLVDKNINAFSTDAETAVVVTEQSPREDCVDEIVRLVKQLIESGKVQDPNQIAFLYPSLKNTSVQAMKTALEREGLKVYAPRAGTFLEVDEAMDVFALFIEIFGRPERNNFNSRDYQGFHDWLDRCERRGTELCREYRPLKDFTSDRRREIEIAVGDYQKLKAKAERNGWNLDAPFEPEKMKRVLFDTPNISQTAKKSLSNRYFERIINDRIAAGNPFTLHYIINSASSLDWNVLDLFYRIVGFDHFKQMFDLAERGEDEGPVCNLGLISGYLARYLDNYTSILTGRFIGGGSFEITFFMAYLYAIFRLGESEYEDADDPFPKGRIPFLTIHQSKGLEFPVVVLPSPSKKNFPPSKSERVVRPFLKREGEPLDRISSFDSMRMFYVALSRAENLLIIGNPRGQGISTFPAFKRIFEEGVTRISQLNLESVPEAKIDTREIPRNYSYTSDYLQYQKCPRQYMLFRKYGFVPSRSQTQFFGTLVHQMLEDLHHLLIGQRNKKQTAAQKAEANL
ncbi:MAG TPA: ATP-dependent DNA helicase [Pyrinomonadaceae bacterium]|jgi:DNA helicase-2/ATP-dependent DNA helicase PcrA